MSEKSYSKNKQRTQKPRGNTKTRGFTLTIFNTDDLKSLINIQSTLDVTKDWMIYGEEICPNTGRKHWQCYIYFHNQKKWSALKKLFTKGAHIEPAEGTAQQNYVYCSKDKKFTTWGTMPQQGKRKWSNDELMNATDEEIIDSDKRCHRAYINARNILQMKQLKKAKYEKYLKIANKENFQLEKPTVIYITGETGSGKTTTANAIAAKLADQFKYEIDDLEIDNNFFESTENKAQILRIEEFRPSQCTARKLLQLMDANYTQVSTKGGFTTLNPKFIIIDTITTVEQLYQKEENNRQFQRRVTHYFNLYEEPYLSMTQQQRTETILKTVLESFP